jgi:predicted DsbA family dithiol-disulfide isomerase
MSFSVSDMRIEIWADVVCGWAYIGKRRLERAVAGMDVEVVWRPFRIDPTTPDEATPLAEALRDPVVDAALQQCAPGVAPAQNRVRVAEIAAAEGIGPGWGAKWRTSSHDAHRLLLLAHERAGAAVQNELAEQVMKAHFLDGADISDREVLAELATKAGFAEGAALLGTAAGDREVRELLLIGKARGITSSPTLVVGDRLLTGAQPSEVIAEFLAAGGEDRRLPAEVQRLRWVESLLAQGDPLGALSLLRPLLAEHPEDPNVRRLAARGYFHSAQLRRAHEVLTALVAAVPDDSYGRLMLGRTLHRMGRAREAAPHLAMAAAMTPGFT